MGPFTVDGELDLTAERRGNIGVFDLEYAFGNLGHLVVLKVGNPVCAVQPVALAVSYGKYGRINELGNDLNLVAAYACDVGSGIIGYGEIGGLGNVEGNVCAGLVAVPLSVFSLDIHYSLELNVRISFVSGVGLGINVAVLGHLVVCVGAVPCSAEQL